MKSKILEKNKVQHVLSGSAYNLRLENNRDQLADEVASILEAGGMEPREIYSGQQVHGKNVEYADGMGGEDFIYGKTFQDTDGLVTDQKGIALLVKFADCTPVVLYDREKEVLGAVHSGWRGTVQRISIELMEKMEEDFGCDRKNMVAYLGPSIDQDNYEVGPEVYEAFSDFKDRESFFEARGEKYQLSMLGANLSLLKEAGLSDEQIEVEETSTYTSSALHSSRQEGKDYQLNALIVMMPEG